MTDPKPAGRERDPDYLKRVKRLACSVRDHWWATLPKPPPCEGVIEAAHVGRRPLGRKCSDREAIPLCGHHHRMLDNGLGGSLFLGKWRMVEGFDEPVYVGMKRGQAQAARRLWLAEQINRTQSAVRELEAFDRGLWSEDIPF